MVYRARKWEEEVGLGEFPWEWNSASSGSQHLCPGLL